LPADARPRAGGLQPLGVFADPTNHTVYVANFGAPALGGNPGNSTTVSMINSATCGATDLAACPTTPPPTVTVGGTPSAVTVDPGNGSAYVSTIGKGLQNGWSVLNATTCNATVQSGCGSIGRLPGDPAGPSDGEVDQANDTFYTANYDNTISAYDLSRCNAADLAGCAHDKPGTVTPWPNPSFQENDLYAAVDQPLHSVYVSYQKDAALVVVNTNVCNGTHLAACARLKPASVHTGADPEGVILDPTTQTLYSASEVHDDISVINASACNAENTRGCRHPAPAVSIPSGPRALATDNAVHTAYVTAGSHSVSMIDMRTCHAGHLAGCAHKPPQFTAGKYGFGIAVDPATHTVYVANGGTGSTGTVSVIDDRTCNATDQAGCADQQTLRVPRGHPAGDGIAVNPRNDTVYVATDTASGPNVISVFNGATCNATDARGCGQTPAVLPVGKSGGAGILLAVNDATNTVYATNNPYADVTGDAVYVFNAAKCDAQNTSGCRQKPSTVTVGNDPAGLAVDRRTDTIYAVVHAEGDYAASVAVINGATCKATNTSGCRQTPASSFADFGALYIAIDPATQHVYTPNLGDTSVSVINGTACNATNTSGCRQTPRENAVGNYPAYIAVDPATNTAYVSNIDDVSVIPTGP
jgi:DNA-binding beta-propeller fold protein YncE